MLGVYKYLPNKTFRKEVITIDLMKCVWDTQIPYVNRLNTIQAKIDELWKINMEKDGKLLKSLRKLKLDFYFKFSNDLDKTKNWSKKYKQLVLAKKVLETIKDWDRKYIIDLSKRIDGEYFIRFFGNDMETTKYHLCSLGINWYSKPSYSLKTLILWATKMKRLGFIGKEKLNSFLSELESISNGK